METNSKFQSVVLMGKTGSGKGTQARNLQDTLGYEIFSTGDRVREIASRNTPLGKKIKEIHISKWVPEWLASYLMVGALLEEYFEKGLIFESVARKPEEAKKLNEIHELLDRSYIVLHLDIPDEVVVERMRKRNRDESDSEENIQRRLEAYREETLQSISFFEEQGKVITIDANRDEQEVLRDIMAAVQA